MEQEVHNRYVLLAVRPQHERLTYLHAMNIPGFIMMMTNEETNGEIFDIITTGLEERFGSLDNVELEELEVRDVANASNHEGTVLFLGYGIEDQQLWQIPTQSGLLRFMCNMNMIPHATEE